MLFLDNPRKKRRKVRRARAKVARRRKRRTPNTTRNTRGQFMARRRRRRHVRHSAPRRRRRSVTLSINPPRRRRRRHHINPRRRHYRRNPGMGTGILGTLKNGIINGLKVNIGEAIQGRAAAGIAKVLPLSGIAATAISELGSAVAIALAARKFAPAHAGFISAGAFANANKHVIAAISPTAGAFLGAYPGGGLGAYVGGGLGDADYIGGGIPEGAITEVPGYTGMGAYPGGGLGDGAMDTNYLIQ